MFVTASELKMNLGKYLLLSATEDIYITKHGKIIAKLSKPFQDKVDLVESHVGILPQDITLEKARADHLNRI